MSLHLRHQRRGDSEAHPSPDHGSIDHRTLSGSDPSAEHGRANTCTISVPVNLGTNTSSDLSAGNGRALSWTNSSTDRGPNHEPNFGADSEPNFGSDPNHG